ncbi:MAG: GNAT family N-acetyltransferase, partial [Acidobacteriota bacterium]
CATGLLQILLLDPAAPPDTAACLIRHVAAAARGRWLVLRADVTSAHRGAWPCFDSEPWHLEHVSVRKKLPERPAWPSVPDGLILRPAGGKDREFVGALFDEATRAAMPTLFESLRTPAQIVAGTERAYRAILDDRPLVLIAERAGERLGHAIASVEVMNETNGRREGILHDVFVLDEHRDRGLSRLLTAAVEALSTEAGERYLIATVTADSPTDRRRLLGLLSGKGWVEFSRRFVRRLSESAGR